MHVTHRTVTSDELTTRRAAILAGLGIGWDELRSRRVAGALTAEEWAAWEELDGIEFLLGDD